MSLNTFSPGKYFVGDLCYHDTLSSQCWDEICDKGEGCHLLKSGIKIATFYTMYGDGSYNSNINTEHWVDSGMIGIVRVPDSADVGQKDGYAIIEFSTHFTCHKDCAVLIFGHVSINTDFDESEIEYSEEDECEEESW